MYGNPFSLQFIIFFQEYFFFLDIINKIAILTNKIDIILKTTMLNDTFITITLV
jgi:hypothetical protein